MVIWARVPFRTYLKAAGWVLTILLASTSVGLRAESNTPTAPPGLTLPSAAQIVVLIRTTLLTLDDAIHTGNFSVMLDKAAAQIRASNTSGSLHKTYAPLIDLKPGLSSVAMLAPELTKAQLLNDGGTLHLDGVIKSSPVTVKFSLVYSREGAKWLWSGIGLTFLTEAPKRIQPNTKSGGS